MRGAAPNSLCLSPAVFTPRVIGTAVARYNFAARDMRELSLREGDVVKIYSRIGGDQGWWKGETNGRVSASESCLVPFLQHMVLPILNLPSQSVGHQEGRGTCPIPSGSFPAQVTVGCHLRKAITVLPSDTRGGGQEQAGDIRVCTSLNLHAGD